MTEAAVPSVNVAAIVALVAYAVLFALILIALIRLVRFLGSADKEIKLTRLELGKLAEEVHVLRKELKGQKE